jgi:hypothetical protein
MAPPPRVPRLWELILVLAIFSVLGSLIIGIFVTFAHQ